jgi:hypothetical protein
MDTKDSSFNTSANPNGSVPFNGTTTPDNPLFVPDHTDIGRIRDLLDAKLSQLTAMTNIITGDGEETFNSWNDTIRGNYLWGISTCADDCKALLALI